MRSLDAGESPIIGVRVPGTVHEEFERRAALLGLLPSELLRKLVDQEIATQLGEPNVTLRPPRVWMTETRYKHRCGTGSLAPCKDRGRDCPVYWLVDPENWAMVQLRHRFWTWDRADELREATASWPCGHRSRSPWYPTRISRLAVVLKVFEGREQMLHVHHVIKEEGPQQVPLRALEAVGEGHDVGE